MSVSFESWLKEGRLKRHNPAKQEIASLTALADRRLADSQVGEVSAEGRFLLAYNAAIALRPSRRPLGSEPESSWFWFTGL